MPAHLFARSAAASSTARPAWARVAGLGAVALLALTACGGSDSSSDSDSASKSACEQEASTKTSIDQAPKVEWKSLHNNSFSLASSADYGPAKTADGFSSCFQHSPEGALVASNDYVVEIFGKVAEGKTDEVKSLLESQALKTDGRDKEIDSFAQGSGSLKEELASAKMDISGYKVDSYSKDKAQFTLRFHVETQGKSQDRSLKFETQWKDGDWKFDLTDSDFIGAAKNQADDGFTAWGPDQS